MYKFVIMGVPGCGKGTQARLLAEDCGMCHISVGEALRGHIQNQTHLGQTVQEQVAAGHMVDDHIANQVVKTRLAEIDCEMGYVLDGFPLNESQAVYLLENFQIDAVINLVVPDNVVMDRMLARRLCSSCGQDFNLVYRPPRIAGVCDECGTNLVARQDDTAEAITERMAAFHAKTEPVMVLFRKHNLLVNVDGTGTIAEVAAEIRRKTELSIS